MFDQQPHAAIVIPNWNGLRWLPGCLRAIAAQTLAPAEVVVVDNGSTDGSLSYLAAEHPEVRVLALGRNTGFAPAANRGLQAVGSGYVALLNTDVVLAADWLQRVVGVLDGDPGAAGVAWTTPPRSTTRATCCAGMGRASSADAFIATTAASISQGRCSAPAPAPRSTAGRP